MDYLLDIPGALSAYGLLDAYTEIHTHSSSHQYNFGFFRSMPSIKYNSQLTSFIRSFHPHVAQSLNDYWVAAHTDRILADTYFSLSSILPAITPPDIPGLPSYPVLHTVAHNAPLDFRNLVTVYKINNTLAEGYAFMAETGLRDIVQTYSHTAIISDYLETDYDLRALFNRTNRSWCLLPELE